jgi:hypothetical protein
VTWVHLFPFHTILPEDHAIKEVKTLCTSKPLQNTFTLVKLQGHFANFQCLLSSPYLFDESLDLERWLYGSGLGLVGQFGLT